MFRGEVPRRFGVVADVLEARIESILCAYESRLVEIGSPLVNDEGVRWQLQAQARAVLEEVAADLRKRDGPPLYHPEGDRLSETIGTSRARGLVHPSESMRAVMALMEAALSIVADNLPASDTSRGEVAAAALAIQRSILERVAHASVSYGSFLLEKIHVSHAEERRRIGRELHDRVAHAVIVLFRNLELSEMYQKSKPERARAKLQEAKATAQEVLKVTRDLSRELRESLAEEGVRAAVLDYLELSVHPPIETDILVEGNDSGIPPHVRGELFLILREAIRNGVVHSDARRIRVLLSTTQDRFRAVIEDDGRGFEPSLSTSRGGTGLSSMRERVAPAGQF